MLNGTDIGYSTVPLNAKVDYVLYCTHTTIIHISGLEVKVGVWITSTAQTTPAQAPLHHCIYSIILA